MEEENHRDPATFKWDMLHVSFLESTLPETNSSHLKIDGWNTSFQLGWPISRCYVRFRECKKTHQILFKPLAGKIS